jgi:hypothetical protein
MALGWCLRIGPGQVLAHVKVDPALDEYAQDPKDGPLYLGCSPTMAQLLKDRYREVVLEGEPMTWDQAQAIGNQVWNAVSDELTQKFLQPDSRDSCGPRPDWRLEPPQSYCAGFVFGRGQGSGQVWSRQEAA